MLGWQACLIVAALGAPADLEVVKFTSEYCAPCRAMEPVLQQVQAEGYRVRSIDWDRNPELAQRYQITAVPTMLVVREGQIVDRIQGAVSVDALLDRLQRADVRTALGAESSMEPPSSPARSLPTAARGDSRELASSDSRERSPQAARGRSDGRAPDSARAAAGQDWEQQALSATARIRVEDEAGQSCGTGTIVDVHGRDALILTCGHLFRDSQGRGEIQVELIAHAEAGPLTGQLIRYDLKRDVALVAIRTDLPLTAVQVAGPDYHVAQGQRLFSVGCNHGEQATVMRGVLRAVNKYLGPENLVVAGLPVDGRSGGGLFSYDGRLVGVCNAADPENDEGLYAAFASIHRHLDDAQLAFVYRGSGTPTDQAVASAAPASPPMGQRALPPISRGGRQPAGNANPASPPDAQPDSVALAGWQSTDSPLASGALGDEPEGAEVICIIRKKDQPDGKSQVVVLERPSQEFIRRLNQERTSQANRQATQLRVLQRPASGR